VGGGAQCGRFSCVLLRRQDGTTMRVAAMSRLPGASSGRFSTRPGPALQRARKECRIIGGGSWLDTTAGKRGVATNVRKRRRL
jgi:hypothetical protein